MAGEPTTYEAAGVDYATLDAGKRAAIASALATSAALAAHGGRAIDASRGAPAFVFEHGGQRLALVLECLGTKSLIARQVRAELGVNRYADIAYDTVAAIVGDLCCVGATPLVVNAYFATGSADFYADAQAAAALRDGWRRACDDASCTWGGGESPSLVELVQPGEIELAGSAVGALPDGVDPILGERLKAGDEIVLVASTGLHANGASLARLIAKRLVEGYGTRLPSGRALGEALLDPALVYSPLVGTLIQRGLVPTYVSHITGHGMLKLMRPAKALTYRIEALPPVPEVLSFLVDEAGLDARAAYSTFNMGAGLALFCPPGSAAQLLAVTEELGLSGMRAGVVEEGPRQVILEPVGVTYGGGELELGAS